MSHLESSNVLGGIFISIDIFIFIDIYIYTSKFELSKLDKPKPQVFKVKCTKQIYLALALLQ